MTSSYYEILKISENASREEIKQSYRKLALENHPDKGGNEEEFKKISLAYEVLNDDNKRKEYDFERKHGQGIPFDNNNNNVPFPFPFPFGFQQQQTNSHEGQQQQAPFNIFNFVNNLNSQGNKSIKKSDQYYNYSVSLKDIYNGVTRKFHIRKKSLCRECNKSCSKCNGTGEISNGQFVQVGPIFHFMNNQCNICMGSSVIREMSCKSCNSTGNINEEKHIELYIEKGIENKKEYRFESWGEQATRICDIAGDFIIVINIEDDVNFKRNNLDLILSMDLSIKESLVGKDIIVPLFDDKFSINTSIFGIINPNKEHMIINKGLCNEKGDRGNLYIKFNINYSMKVLNEEERKLLDDVLTTLKL